MQSNSPLTLEGSYRESSKSRVRKSLSVWAMFIPIVYFLLCFYRNLTTWGGPRNNYDGGRGKAPAPTFGRNSKGNPF